eukprot:gnl/Spiro4/4242_TR2126_c0_g1_i1.p2 gnl/Spiro4/4242_TR2126_c0_g1~~gnl/Spiro4/4242_TR2126_c0_g1_i1.p2  ORF type:complete len:113 (+),score=10.66 gnl/Spiro4/4242_TR2126_c0_g1_i1:167-505(+)
MQFSNSRVQGKQNAPLKHAHTRSWSQVFFMSSTTYRGATNMSIFVTFFACANLLASSLITAPLILSTSWLGLFVCVETIPPRSMLVCEHMAFYIDILTHGTRKKMRIVYVSL